MRRKSKKWKLGHVIVVQVKLVCMRIKLRCDQLVFVCKYAGCWAAISESEADTYCVVIGLSFTLNQSVPLLTQQISNAIARLSGRWPCVGECVVRSVWKANGNTKAAPGCIWSEQIKLKQLMVYLTLLIKSSCSNDTYSETWIFDCHIKGDSTGPLTVLNSNEVKLTRCCT